ncbi:DNRLRE domain-containing protein, partial [bacterium]|nr:DNRLRE domain-containing protein [bacterium]
MRNIAGRGASATIFIVTSGPATLTFEPTDDSFVRENRPSDVSGAGDVLRVRESNSGVQQISYLKFNVTGITREVENATLKLFVRDGGGQAGSIFLVSNNWEEETVNWNNAPPISGSPLMSLGGVSAGQVTEFVVTSAIDGNGAYSFAIRTGSDDAVEFSSKEVNDPPQLVIEQSGGPAPNAPAITAFSPAGGVVGSEVTINGINFLPVTNVFFNSIPASSFSVDSNTQIRAVVGAGTVTGKLGVSSLDGTAISVTDFVIVSPPTISLFSPTSGPIGTVVTLIGNNFTGTTSVSLNGLAASSFTVNGGSQMTLVVPAGASSGPISVTNAAGTSQSNGNFTVVQVPAVSGFTPGSGPTGTEVTITGNNFSALTSVAFNGVTAPGFTIESASQIKVAVPANATTGRITVTNTAGTGNSSAS